MSRQRATHHGREVAGGHFRQMPWRKRPFMWIACRDIPEEWPATNDWKLVTCKRCLAVARKHP